MNAFERVQLAQRFYGALAAGDVAGILAALDRDLRAEITVGLPEGWGGVYASARELLEQCWRPMFDKVEVRPMPREYFACAEDSVVVHGEYRRALAALSEDLKSGTWDKRHGHLRQQDDYDGGLRLIVADSPRPR